MNSKTHFHSPIHAVLCDGQKFDFFIFNSYADLLKPSRGVFPRLDGIKSPTIHLPHYGEAEYLEFVKALGQVGGSRQGGSEEGVRGSGDDKGDRNEREGESAGN